MKYSTRSTALTLLFGAGLVGCRHDSSDDRAAETSASADSVPARADWPAGVAPQVDSGNAAFSAQDYAAALRHYRRAAELGPQVSAAWFGIYAAEHTRGNLTAADSAMQRARELVRDTTPSLGSPAEISPEISEEERPPTTRRR
jgi:tetratricopeptide (TPR) repeat protein